MRHLWTVMALACAIPVQAAAQDTVAARIAALGRINSAFSPTLSPDGARMAYLSNESGSPQIWVRELKSGATPRQLTRLSDPVGVVQWSPTGDWLAYTVSPGAGSTPRSG